MNADATLELPFDQYQRYRLVADILESLRARDERFSVLDVGGRTALLRKFLPLDEVYLVDVEASPEAGLVLGDGSALPYATDSVDALVTFDTLEHVPPARREAFVAECARVARRWVVIAGPYQSPRVEEAESQLERFIHEKLGQEHRYLAEHKQNGLPDREQTEAGLRTGGGRVVSIGHANLERWLALMCLSLYMDRDAPLRGIAKHFFRFYNAELYASDHAEPVYRHAVVAAMGQAPLPEAAELLARPVAPTGAVDLSMELARELLRFDVQRDAIVPEWQRLEEVNQGLQLDLEGHKDTLLALRRVQDEQTKVIAELQQQCIELHSNEEELEEELERERSESQAVITNLRAELAEHAKVVEELGGRVRKLSGELTEARNVREEAELAHHVIKRDLDGHRALVDNLRQEIEGASRTNVELEAARHAAAQRAAKLEQQTHEQRAALEASSHRALSAEESVEVIRAEFEAQNERLRVLTEELATAREVLNELRQELRKRWGNLRRAFGPKPKFGPD